MGFFEDDSRISNVFYGRRLMSRRPGPSIAAAGDKPNFMVFEPYGAIFRGGKIRIPNNINMLIFWLPV